MGDRVNEARAYVEKMRAKGCGDEEIRQDLRQAGWNDHQIHDLLATDMLQRYPPPAVSSSHAPRSPRGRKSSSALKWIVMVALGVGVAALALWLLWVEGEKADKTIARLNEELGITAEQAQDIGKKKGLSGADQVGGSVGYAGEPRAGRQAEEELQHTTARTWQRVVSWGGQGIKTTPKFTVGGEWAIEWKTAPGQYGDMNFQIFIYSGDGSVAGGAANVIGAGHETTYQHQAGTYYLEVNSGQPWEIVVWEKR